MNIQITVKRSGEEKTYSVPYAPRMRILDSLLFIQENLEPDLAFRWNCGEGVCGSCAGEVDGKPVLMCKAEIVENMQNIRIEPLKVFPVIKDLVTNPSEVYEKLSRLKPYFTGKEGDGFFTIYEREVRKSQEMRKCIDCFICYDSCHVIRNHPNVSFTGPINIVKAVAQDSHPQNAFSRIRLLEKEGVKFCNVSRCCTENCPQGIKITENAIIPLKEKIISDIGIIGIIKSFRSKKNE